MTTENSQNGNGATAPRRIALVLEYDEATHLVSVGGAPMPIALAQMICGEGARLLEEQRRIAAAEHYKGTILQQLNNQRVVEKLRR